MYHVYSIQLPSGHENVLGTYFSRFREPCYILFSRVKMKVLETFSHLTCAYTFYSSNLCKTLCSVCFKVKNESFYHVLKKRGFEPLVSQLSDPGSVIFFLTLEHVGFELTTFGLPDQCFNLQAIQSTEEMRYELNVTSSREIWLDKCLLKLKLLSNYWL